MGTQPCWAVARDRPDALRSWQESADEGVRRLETADLRRTAAALSCAPHTTPASRLNSTVTYLAPSSRIAATMYRIKIRMPMGIETIIHVLAVLASAWAAAMFPCNPLVFACEV